MPASVPATSRSTALTIMAIVCVLLCGSFLGTPIPGTNEPHYLSKARATTNPNWCVNDFFLQSENAHAVFFAIVGPFADQFPFVAVIEVGRFFSLLILGVGLHLLFAAVGCDGRRAVLSTGLFYLIGMTGNFSGEWVIGGFESKVPAYGFALIGLATCIRNRCEPGVKGYVVAGLFTGLAVALHPVVGMWTAIAISMTEVWLWIKPAETDAKEIRGLPSLLRRGATFGFTSFVFALPGLIPAFQMLLSSNVDVATQRMAKQIQVFYRLAHHLDPMRFPAFSWWHTATLIAALTGTVLWIRNRRQPTGSETSEDNSKNKNCTMTLKGLSHAEAYLLKFLVCSAIIAAVGIAIGWRGEAIEKMDSRHWRAALLQFYPFRLFDAFLPLTTAVFLSAIPIMRLVQTDEADFEDRSCLKPEQDGNPFSSTAMTAVLVLAICSGAAISKRPSSPSGYSPELYAEWQQACEWLKKNTPEDSLIFAPRESFALKLLAERAEYVSFKDCPQDAGGIVEWNRRLWKLNRWSKQSYQDNVFDSAELAKLKQKMGIDYVLTRRLGSFAQPPIWKGNAWRIYATVKSDVVRDQATANLHNGQRAQRQIKRQSEGKL